MKYTKKCPTCGHQATAYTHNINASSVKALLQLVDFYEANKRPAKMKELSLTNSQYTNFNRLTYFSLAYLTENGERLRAQDNRIALHGAIACIKKSGPTK